MATYVEDLIEVLLPYEDGLDRQQVLAKLETLRRDRGHRIRPKFVQTAQKAYESRCVGYESFDKTGWPESEALFFSPGGKGSGVWAVNSERARAWLRKRGVAS